MITALLGANRFAVQQELDAAASDYVKQYGDFGLERLDGGEDGYDRIREAVQSLPFLSDKKIVILKDPSLQKQFQDDFETLLPTIPDTTDVFIVESKPDKRSSYYKALKKLVQVKEFNEPDAVALERWSVQYVKNNGGSLSQADARYLIHRVGLGQQALSGELQKLLAYNPDITKATIDNLTERSPQSTIFDLIDAAMNGRAEQALGLYDEQRRMKVEPQQVLAMLAWQLHVMTVIKTAGNRSPEEIAKQAGINPYVVKKTSGLLRTMPFSHLQQLLRRALEMDIRQKTSTFDLDEALKSYILSIKA